MFDTLKEARVWLSADAIAEAVLPFRTFLAPAHVDRLAAFLDDAIATHPALRTFATRAAKTHVIPVVREIRAAAREPEDEEPIPLGTSIRETEPDPFLLGKPDIRRKEFITESISIVKGVARDVARKWGRTDIDDMVNEGWIAAIEHAPNWDGTKSAYKSFLWGRVHARLTNYAKRAYHRREKLLATWGDDVAPAMFDEHEAEPQFREAVGCFATSAMLTLVTSAPDAPDDEIQRAATCETVRAAWDALPQRQAKVLHLALDGEGMELKEVATVVGISYATVKRDNHVALKTLRKKLAGSSNVRPLRPVAA